MRDVRRAGLLFAVCLALLLPFAARAQEPHRAGLVVVQGDGAVTSRCVEFTEEALTGYELVARSGLDFTVEASAMGASICSLAGEGCRFPQESCFCQCKGNPCVYWSYWTLEEEGWLYANRGASVDLVQSGDVQAWVWGAGTVDKAAAPPPRTFAEICPVPAEALAEPPAASAPNPASEQNPAAGSNPAAGPAPVETPASDGTEPAQRTTAWLWLAVAAALPLFLVILLRRKTPRA